MPTLLTAAFFAAAAAAGSTFAPHPLSPAHVPNAQVPTAQRLQTIPQVITTKLVKVGELSFRLPSGWNQQGNRFSPADIPGVTVTVSDPTAISTDFRSWFTQRAGELRAASTLLSSPTIETPKQGFTLEQTESHPSGAKQTLFAAADLGNGQVQTITFEAPDQATFTNWKPSVDAMLTTLSR